MRNKIFKDKMKVIETIVTVEGTLYKDEIVTFEGTEQNGDYRVKDSMGRIWFVKEEKLK
jgi:hypothetical protein